MVESVQHKTVNRAETFRPAAPVKIKRAAANAPEQVRRSAKVSSVKDPEEQEAGTTAKKIRRMVIPESTIAHVKGNGGGVIRQGNGAGEKAIFQTRPQSPSLARFSDSGIFSQQPRGTEESKHTSGGGEKPDVLQRMQGPRSPEGIAGPVSGALPPAGNVKEKNDGAAGTKSIERIAAAPDSPLKAHTIALAQLINGDGIVSEAQVVRIAATRRRQINTHFAIVRRGLTGFFTSSIVGIQTRMATKQSEITAASARALAWVRTTIAGTLQAAQAQSTQIRERIHGMIEGISSSVQRRIEGIAGRITGLIDSVPLPDIPGIARIRGIAVNLLRRAAGIVNGALGKVLGFIRSAFNAGMRLLGLFLQFFGQLADEALATASAVILRIMQLIFQSLNRTVNLIVATLTRALHGALLPVLDRLKISILHGLADAERQALAQLRFNREQHLEALTAAVIPGAGSGEKGGAAERTKVTSIEGYGAAVRAIALNAIRNNRMIVQAFEVRTSGTSVLIIQAITAAVGQIIRLIAARITLAAQRVVSAVSRIMQNLTQVVQAVANFSRSVIHMLTAALGSLLRYVRLLVQSPVDQLIEFAQRTLSRVRDFIMRIVRNLISGSGGLATRITEVMGDFMLTKSSVGPESSLAGGPITKPLPAPMVIMRFLFAAIILAVHAILALLVGEALAAVIAAAILAHPILAVIVVVIAVLILLLLLYLLYTWLIKPRLPVPLPPPPGCAITTRTLVSAPDGTPDTRKTVGVRERVEMTSSSPATWSAIHGTVAPARGTTVVWTAPAAGVTSVVRATLVTGKQCVRFMHVVAPKGLSMIKATSHPLTPGTAGACMVTNVTVHPLSVCLGATQWLEVPGPATKVSGYFTKFSPAALYHHPNPGYLPFNDSNTGLRDHAAWHAVPGPYSTGQFQWDIPNRYKVDGEPDSSGRLFTTTTQIFTMDSSGAMTISKAGASVSRSP